MQIENPIPERYRPGQPLPNDARCEYSYGYSYDFRYCTVDNNIYISFDNSRNQITSVSMVTRQYTVGDYINAYGPPDGIENWRSYSRSLWWGDTYVYTYGKFQPTSRTYFFSMRKRPDDLKPWKGFIEYK